MSARFFFRFSCPIVVVAFAGVGAVSACDDEVYDHSDRACDGRDGVCSCAADDWCVDYADAAGASFAAGDCAERGGVEAAVACADDDVAGACVGADGCVVASFNFFADYDGGLGDSVDVDEAEAACRAGELITEPDCAVWQD